jgi:hypothetical protein
VRYFRELLETLDMPREAVEHEMAAMELHAYGPTRSRRVLSTMNQMAFEAGILLGGGADLQAVTIKLARTLRRSDGSGRPDLRLPEELARELCSTGCRSPSMRTARG